MIFTSSIFLLPSSIKKYISSNDILSVWLSLVFRLLDDLGNEIEMTDSKLQTMLIRVEKVLKLADGRFILYQCSWQAFMLSQIINKYHEGLFSIGLYTEIMLLFSLIKEHFIRYYEICIVLL